MLSFAQVYRGLINGALGVAACGVLVIGTLTSIGGLPGFSPRLGFISELAVPRNQHAGRLNVSFMIGGALVVLFALAVATTRGAARRRAARVAGASAAIAGVGVMLVGVYPLTRPVPHLLVALVLGIAAVVSAIASARVVRGSAHADPRLGLAVTVAMWSLAAMVAMGVGYFAWVCVHADVSSLDSMFRQLPRELPVRIGGTWYNPLAVLEWAFFGVLSLMLLGASIAEATGLAARSR